MNVPPLITAAVSATAKAPSDRLPRKYFSRKLPFRPATLATTPRPSEISVKRTSAINVGGWAWIALTLFMQAPLPDVLLELVGVILPQLIVGHVESRKPEHEQGTNSPRDDHPEEEP